MFGRRRAFTVISMSETVVSRVPTPLFVGDAEGGSTTGGFVLPTGTVTFLMTDIEGSTRAWQRRPEALTTAVPRHYDILDEAITSHGGVRPVEQGEGDSVVAAFSRASDALKAAITAQRMLAAEEWTDGLALNVRMALHTGEAQLRDEGNYFGLAVIRCARLRSCGHGGQVLLSDVTAALVADELGEGMTLTDLGRHRLKDLGRPERVWQLVHPDLQAEFPPLMSVDAYRQNLPVQLTPLIGRRAEIAELVATLDGERLVTLTGSGGVGKTRLALAVGAELLAAFPGGVWFVELAGTRGAGSVGRATLKALGLPETPAVAPAEVAAVELGEGGRSLVILDNCEHLIAECAEFVVTVLGAGVDVSVLATSREQLGVAGEVAWRVPSLASPPRDGLVPVEALSQYDAVNLFVDRARRARPSFTVNETNAAAIAQVCHRLDGIPLAVELAAARCRHMSIEQMADELDDRFRLLTGGSRMVMPRQQTLAASVEWSYELLDDVERRVLRRLGVFAGPFSLYGRRGGGDRTGRCGFDRRVRHDQSAGRQEPGARRRSRRRVALPPPRDDPGVRRQPGARSRRADDACATPIRRGGAPGSTGLGVTGPTDDVIALVDANHDDLVAALSWAADRDTELGLRLLLPLARAFMGTGRAGDAMPAFDTLLTPAVEQQHPELWLRAAVSAAIPVLGFRGRQAFDELLSRCEARAVELDDDYAKRCRGGCWGCRSSTEPGAAAAGAPSTTSRSSSPWPRSGWPSMPLSTNPRAHARRCSRLTLSPASYHSRYIPDYARAAHGMQELVFGDLAVVIAAGYELVDSRHPTDAGTRSPAAPHRRAAPSRPGRCRRGDGGGPTRRRPAGPRIRSARRQPRSTSTTSCATSQRSPAHRCRRRVDPWLDPRDAVDRGDLAAARTMAESLAPAAPRSRPWPTPSPVCSTAARTTGTKPCGSPTNTGSA